MSALALGFGGFVQLGADFGKFRLDAFFFFVKAFAFFLQGGVLPFLFGKGFGQFFRLKFALRQRLPTLVATFFVVCYLLRD